MAHTGLGTEPLAMGCFSRARLIGSSSLLLMYRSFPAHIRSQIMPGGDLNHKVRGLTNRAWLVYLVSWDPFDSGRN